MIFYLFGIFIYVVPGLWVNYTLNKHDDVLPNMPFTAKEFGLNLLKEQDLENVKIEDTKIGDHYDPNSKTVSGRVEMNAQKTTDVKRTIDERLCFLRSPTVYAP